MALLDSFRINSLGFIFLTKISPKYCNVFGPVKYFEKSCHFLLDASALKEGFAKKSFLLDLGMLFIYLCFKLIV